MTVDVAPAGVRARGAAGRRRVVGVVERLWRRPDGELRDWRGPVPVALFVAAVLHVLWRIFLANAGGDLAAQDAWAEFTRAHPDSAINLSWYGGMHVASYSAIAPRIMDVFGVRTTLMMAGTASAGLLAWLLQVRLPTRRPLWPAVYGAAAFAGNAISGRATFALGNALGLVAMVVVFAWLERWEPTDPARRRAQRRWRGVATVVLAALATMSSPVSGLFLGVVAAALWLQRRRAAALAIGLPPTLIVASSAVLFPFGGIQPMHVGSVWLPLVMGLSMMLLVPRGWKVLRAGGAVYIAAVLFAWLVPSPIGTNVTRLGLIFGGTLLVAVATGDRPARTGRSVLARRSGKLTAAVLLGMSLITATVWQVAVAAQDAVHQRPPASWSRTIEPLVKQLHDRNAFAGRVEAVPTRSHRESTALAPYVNLARGWNRQADLARNAVFYNGNLGPHSYHRWLRRWGVRFVVLSRADPDPAARHEARLIRRGLPYLTEVWSNRDWRLYQVSGAQSMVSGDAQVLDSDAAELTLYVPRPQNVVVRIPDSPWLSLVDDQGAAIPGPDQDHPALSCLTDLTTYLGVDHRDENWLVVRARTPGVYRIAAPYKLPRGTSCLPTDD